jgi:hypothetical protein
MVEIKPCHIRLIGRDKVDKVAIIGEAENITLELELLIRIRDVVSKTVAAHLINLPTKRLKITDYIVPVFLKRGYIYIAVMADGTTEEQFNRISAAKSIVIPHVFQ